MKKILALTALALVLAASSALAQALGTSSVAPTLTLNVGPEAALTLQSSNVTFSTPSLFNDYTAGPTNFTYFIRTSQTSGTGTISVQITTDFSNGSNGQPSVANPPTSTDLLTYTCSIGNPTHGTVTPCSGSVTAVASPTPATTVATFGADSRSPKAGIASSVSWNLKNDPLYPTGQYVATATFTISAT